MKRAINPFAPGAGNQPPELAGREQILEDADVALERIKAGRPDRGQFLLGLRGVGKTVLLNQIEALARKQGYSTCRLEASEANRLAEQLVPRLRGILLKLSVREKAKDLAQRGLGVLRGFASAFKVTIAGAEIEVTPQPGTADSGILEVDLPELLMSVGEAAKADDTAVALFIDEVQYLDAAELTALIVSIHRVGQMNLPVILFGAGLPQIVGIAGDAKSYVERLFRYPDVGQLPPAAAADAIRLPLHKEGVAIDDDALSRIVEQTQGYPYFLQEWGYHAWNVADGSPITLADVQRASNDAIRQLDEDFFRVRFDRLTPREKDYVRAMASLGPGAHRSAAIASAMGAKSADALGSLRNDLIKKGMVYSPEHGETAFTVPMFDAYMMRSIPRWTPPKAGQGGRGRRSNSAPGNTTNG